ncbi:MAG: 6-phosphogluconolactonase [Burkholderia plantarii]|nr:MAG: 6-phosphogluconolactonase [Burkholderia plantarii]
MLGEFHARVLAIPRDPVTGALGEAVISEAAPPLAHLPIGAPRPPAPTAPCLWAADLHVSPDGRFVFFSERTASRLVTLRVGADRQLTYVGSVETETQPRGFRVSADGTLLAACGEQSTFVSLYRIDAETGALTLAERIESGCGSNWIEILPLHANA